MWSSWEMEGLTPFRRFRSFSLIGASTSALGSCGAAINEMDRRGGCPLWPLPSEAAKFLADELE